MVFYGDVFFEVLAEWAFGIVSAAEFAIDSGVGSRIVDEIFGVLSCPHGGLEVLRSGETRVSVGCF